MNKKNLRKATLEALTLIQTKFPNRQAIIWQHLFRSTYWQESSSIGITIAKMPEIDTRAIIEYAWKCGKMVSVPRIHNETKTMTFYEIDNFSQLEWTKNNLFEPKESNKIVAKEAIGLLIVPGLVFNNSGHRVGFGGGYYDRFLTNYRGKTIALAFSEQMANSFKIEKHDLPVQRLITEQGEYEFRQVKQRTPKTLLTLTNGIILLNVLIFLLMMLNDQSISISTNTLIMFGAKYPNMLAEGQWWRLLAPAFLHANAMHILLNMFGLYFLGNAIEIIYGKKKWLVLFLFSSVGSVLLSYFISMTISVGASGVVFGFLGASLYAAFFIKSIYKIDRKNLIFMLILNLAIGFTSDLNIDNAGHIGGFIGGILGATLVSIGKKNNN